MEPAIQISDVSYSYRRGPVALHNVSLSVPQGQKVAVMGGKASGKTTLFRCLNRSVKFSGKITLLGTSVSSYSRRTLAGISHEVFFILDLIEDGSAARTRSPNYRKLISAARRDDGEAADQVLESWNVGDKWHLDARQLSSGLRKRVLLATLEILQPKLLVADSPTADLDISGIRQLHQLLQSMGCTCLLATHDLQLAATLDRVVILKDGTVAADGAASAILANRSLLLESGIM